MQLGRSPSLSHEPHYEYVRHGSWPQFCVKGLLYNRVAELSKTFYCSDLGPLVAMKEAVAIQGVIRLYIRLGDLFVPEWFGLYQELSLRCCLVLPS